MCRLAGEALKRLAIRGQDTERELQFFLREIRSARFAVDCPLPRLQPPIWKSRPWVRMGGSVLWFWARLFDQLISDFGRSLVRPLAFRLLVIFAAGGLLSQPKRVSRMFSVPLKPGDGIL
jgi:hypothetical protein